MLISVYNENWVKDKNQIAVSTSMFINERLGSVDPYLDKEALRVIKTMPKWKPGKQRGKAVRVKYTVPVTFKLQ